MALKVEVLLLEERLSGVWLWVAEATPLLHPVRLARMGFLGDWSPIALWDLGYMLGVSGVLLLDARRRMRARLEL